MKSKKSKPNQKSPAPGKSIRSLRRGTFAKGFWDLPTGRLILLVLIMGLGIFMRLAFLSADPPLNLSWSMDLNTDPGQYTSFARSRVLWGEWQPFENPFLTVWLNSAYSLIFFFFFTLLGVGRWQANLMVGVLSSLTLLFFYLAIKRGVNQKAGLLATFFLGINFILVMYSRNTFAEVPVVFFFVLGTYFLVLGSRRGWFLVLSGVWFASSILFCKVSAWFIVPVCLGVLALTAGYHSSERSGGKKWSSIWLFVLGLLVVTLVWFLTVCSGSLKTVYDFVFGMSVGMYGSPQALGSLSDFIYSLFSFGEVTQVLESEAYSVGTDLFYRMPFLFVLSLLFLLSYLARVFKAKRILENFRSYPQLELFFGLWMVVGIFSLMPWNYRPLRYQILVIPPLCALAAFYALRFLDRADVKEKARTSVWFWIFSIPTASFLIFHTSSFFLKFFQKQARLDSVVMFSFASSFVLHGVYYLVKRKTNLSPKKRLRAGVVTVVILLIFLMQGGQFLNFAQNVQYSFLRASQDLGHILNPEAVISGPFAQTLTLDNKLKLMLRMFAGWPPDPELFQKYPLTHLALEAQGGQREQASGDYPQVMAGARLVATYFLRNFPVQILRVAESTGNPEAMNYPLSDFERAQVLKEEGQTDSAAVLLRRFVSQYPQNLSGYVTLAQIYNDRQDFENAALYLRKASEFDPTNSLIHQFLGKVYLNLCDQQGDDAFKLLAIKEWERALMLFPQNTELLARLKAIRGD